jgi:hypothetical protein
MTSQLLLNLLLTNSLTIPQAVEKEVLPHNWKKLCTSLPLAPLVILPSANFATMPICYSTFMACCVEKCIGVQALVTALLLKYIQSVFVQFTL